MAFTTGAMATQGTSRISPSERWLPSSSRAVLYTVLVIKCRPVCPALSGCGSGQQPLRSPATSPGRIPVR
ncbi:hypothetical protein STENM36S_02088 [Streptomyces tendae]